MPNKFILEKLVLLKINNTLKHDANLVLKGFKNYYSTLAENLLKMLPKAPNKYSVNTVLAKPISDLYNLSINSEKFPDLCKVATLKPLYLKGSLTQPCNYRPISLLPLISKVITKVIHNQASTSEFKKFITYLPIRFSKKTFSDFCLSYLNDKILTGFDKGMMNGMILIDLQKAFDTIDHDTFL